MGRARTAVGRARSPVVAAPGARGAGGLRLPRSSAAQVGGAAARGNRRLATTSGSRTGAHGRGLRRPSIARWPPWRPVGPVGGRARRTMTATAARACRGGRGGRPARGRRATADELGAIGDVRATGGRRRTLGGSMALTAAGPGGGRHRSRGDVVPAPGPPRHAADAARGGRARIGVAEHGRPEVAAPVGLVPGPCGSHRSAAQAASGRLWGVRRRAIPWGYGAGARGRRASSQARSHGGSRRPVGPVGVRARRSMCHRSTGLPSARESIERTAGPFAGGCW
jgi:hypothetical protein